MRRQKLTYILIKICSLNTNGNPFGFMNYVLWHHLLYALQAHHLTTFAPFAGMLYVVVFLGRSYDATWRRR